MTVDLLWAALMGIQAELTRLTRMTEDLAAEFGRAGLSTPARVAAKAAGEPAKRRGRPPKDQEPQQDADRKLKSWEMAAKARKGWSEERRAKYKRKMSKIMKARWKTARAADQNSLAAAEPPKKTRKSPKQLAASAATA